jgi:hypothetical protein
MTHDQAEFQQDEGNQAQAEQGLDEQFIKIMSMDTGWQKLLAGDPEYFKFLNQMENKRA